MQINYTKNIRALKHCKNTIDFIGLDRHTTVTSYLILDKYGINLNLLEIKDLQNLINAAKTRINQLKNERFKNGLFKISEEENRTTNAVINFRS